MRFYPNNLVKYKSNFFQYAKNSLHVFVFFTLQFLYFNYHLIFETENYVLLLGIGVTLTSLYILLLSHFFKNIEDYKMIVVRFEKQLGPFENIIIDVIVGLLFYILFIIFFQGNSGYKLGDYGFILVNKTIVINLISGIVIGILYVSFKIVDKLSNKFSVIKNNAIEESKEIDAINHNTLVLNVITEETADNLLMFSKNSNSQKNIEIGFGSIDEIILDITLKGSDGKQEEYRYKFLLKDKKIKISEKNDVNLFKIYSIDAQGHLDYEDDSRKLNCIDIQVKSTDQSVQVEIKSNSDDLDYQIHRPNLDNYYLKVKKSTVSENQFFRILKNVTDIKDKNIIYLVEDTIVKEISTIPIIFNYDTSGYGDFKIVTEIENFRFQDLDVSRKETVNNLFYTSFFEKNIYDGFFLKTHLNNTIPKTNKKHIDINFKSSHIFLVLEDLSKLDIVNKLNKFVKFFDELKSDFNGYNIKISIPSYTKTIEILHNVYSKEKFNLNDNFGLHKINKYDYLKIINLYKNDLNKIQESIEFDFNKDIKNDKNNGLNYIAISQSGNKKDVEYITISHADFLPFDGEIGAFNKLFSRNIDETIKFSFTKFNQKSNNKNKILRNTDKYFKKIYPDKKIYKLRYKSEEGIIRSGIMKMFDGIVYNISVEVIKKISKDELSIQTSSLETYKSQGIYLKMSFNDHMKQASMFFNPTKNMIDSKEDYLHSGVFLATGRTLSELGIFGESQDFNPEGGIYLGKNLDVNQNKDFEVPVYVDLSEYVAYNKTEVSSSNGHMVIIGKSGSGKTYLTKSIIHQKKSISRRQIIVFDIEDDYEVVGTSEANKKTQIIDIASYDYGVNPFKIVFHPDELQELKNNEKIFSRHLYFLQNFLKEVFNVTDDKFESEIYALITHLYKLKKITSETIKKIKISDIDKNNYPIMQDLLEAINFRRLEIKNNPELQEVKLNYDELNQLYILIENQLIELLKDNFWSKKFNKNHEELKFDDYDVIRINLKEVIRSSKVIKTYNLSLRLLMNTLEVHIFNRKILEKEELNKLKVNDQNIGTFIVVDEAHRYFRKEMLFMIDFFASIAKQGRKRIIELCMVSQNISDFYRQSDSKDIEQKASDIIKNSGYKFVLQVAQDYDRIYDFIESGFELSEIEKTRLRSINRYRVYLIQGPFKRTMIHIKALDTTKTAYSM